MRNWKTMMMTMACLFAVAMSVAAPRDKAAMQSAAQRVLTPRAAGHNAPQMKELKTFSENPAYSIFGYEQGGFAVVSADDLLPEVLGYSEKKFNDGNVNPNFQWWLTSVEKAAAYLVENNIPATTVTPDPARFDLDVPGLLTTTWGQQEPYNNMCPYGTSSGQHDWQDYGGGDGRCVTGCVATAMAQILNFHAFPPKGQGTHSVRVGGQTYTVDFGEGEYDYANMLDSYAGEYTEEEGRAVARLMYHCGVAADMEYATDGSGTQVFNCLNGLHRNFGFGSEVKSVARDNYGEKAWMDMIFGELTEGRPILYVGVDYSIFAGHAFVFDGYDATGKVRVNWGWNGDDDGFYEVALLNPPGLKFNAGQEMITGIQAPDEQFLNATLDVTPGQLSTLISPDDRNKYGTLTINGTLNGDDLSVLRQMSGNDAQGKNTRGRLAVLDLTNARLVSGGNAFLTLHDRQYAVTAGDCLPAMAFYGCKRLTTLKLPATLKAVGNGAFADCQRLTTLVVSQPVTAAFEYDDGIFYTPGRKEIITVAPMRTNELTIGHDLVRLHDYALAGCTKLSGIRTLSYQPIEAGDNTFHGIAGHVRLYYPIGTADAYKQSAAWAPFFEKASMLQEIGTLIKARNKARYYGDPNPILGYVMSGDFVTGTPEIICEARQDSPAGKYTIHLERGTIDADILVLEDGFLAVAQAPLTVSIADAQRGVHEADPQFHLSFSGFKLNDDESAIRVMPTVTTTATYGSPAGTYAYKLEGGEADNYFFKYDGKGVFTIVDNMPTAITPQPSDTHYDITTLSGTVVRRNAPTTANLPKGIYIINGKKVVVK